MTYWIALAKLKYPRITADPSVALKSMPVIVASDLTLQQAAFPVMGFAVPEHAVREMANSAARFTDIAKQKRATRLRVARYGMIGFLGASLGLHAGRLPTRDAGRHVLDGRIAQLLCCLGGSQIRSTLGTTAISDDESILLLGHPRLTRRPGCI